MKITNYIFLLLLLALPSLTKAQLPDGSIAPDWTLTDIYGNQHHLYDLLDDGKMVVIEFSATWCGPCWNYMLSGALEDFWDEYGPNGTDEAQVYYIESDWSTGMDDLLGQTGESQGNWVANIPFPIIDLAPGDQTANNYDINYYPTLFAVCSDRLLYELGQVPADVWAAFIQSCGLTAEVADVVDADCYGEGEATVEAAGGNSPITYFWSNGDHTATMDGVGAGNYSVTVTEGLGRFKVIDDVVIGGAVAPFGLDDAEIENVDCHGTNTGSIEVTLENGTAPYDYDWSNGSHAATLSNVPADEYTLNVTDANGCVFETDFEITQPEAIEVESELTPDYCDQANGTIALAIQGGVGGYDISSSDGTIFGNDIIDLEAGSVSVDVEDNNGCVWSDNFEIEAAPAPDLYFTPNPHITCVQPTTVVTGYVNDGSGEYSFAWTTTNGHITGPVNQSNITVDAAGDYHLLVNDILTGCEVENSVAVVSQFDPPPASAGDDAPLSCEVPQLTLNGAGGDSYTVTWTTTNGHIVSGANTYNPVVDLPGDYNMTVYNPVNQCSNTDAVVVINDVHPAQAAYQYQTSALTMIGNDQSSGSNVGNWSWTFGDGGTSTEPNVIHTYAAPGTYNVCLSVSNACGTTQTCQNVEVTFVGSVISVDAVISNVLCNADSTGAATLIVNGGSGVYSYNWTGPNGASYDTSSISGLIAGTYQVVVSDDAGNLFIGEYSITEPAPIVLTNAAIVNNNCYGEALGGLTIDVVGGVGPFSYAFNGGASQVENYIQNQTSGDVICAVTDANGCVFITGPHTIAQPADLAYASQIATVRCNGEANGSIHLDLSGAVAPYTYLWDVGGNTTPDVSQLPAGTYHCQVTDQNGCIDIIAIEMTQPDVLNAAQVQVVDASGPDHNNGSITVEPAGGTAPYEVNWNTGFIGNKIENLTPGEYTYVITDVNGCTFSPSAPVIIQSIVATKDIDWSAYVSLTPNPSDGDVVVTWHDLNFGAGVVNLVSIDGTVLSTNTVNAANGTWDLTGLDLRGGVYVVLFKFNKQHIPLKLIVVD